MLVIFNASYSPENYIRMIIKKRLKKKIEKEFKPSSLQVYFEYLPLFQAAISRDD